MDAAKLHECVELLTAKRWTVAFAEGGSEGKVCYEFSELPDADTILVGGMVAMKDHMKEYFFGIQSEVLKKYGSESPEVAKLMADNLCKYLKSDISVSITIASPIYQELTCETALQSVFVHILFPHKTVSKEYEFAGNKARIAQKTVDAIAQLIIDEINTYRPS